MQFVVDLAGKHYFVDLYSGSKLGFDPYEAVDSVEACFDSGQYSKYKGCDLPQWCWVVDCGTAAAASWLIGSASYWWMKIGNHDQNVVAVVA